MSVDLRTRVDGVQNPVDLDRLFKETLPARFDAHQSLLVDGAAALPLQSLSIEVGESSWTLTWNKDRVGVAEGKGGAACVRLTLEQLTDLVDDQSTPVALMTNGLLDMPSGRLEDFLNWWLVLRAALDARRIYAPGDVVVQADTPRSFTPDDSDEEMRAFLEEVGYLHIRGLFSKEEMAQVEADFDRAAPNYVKGDPLAWFATTQDGVEHLVRMEGFDRYSEIASSLVAEDRFLRIGRIPGLDHVPANTPGRRVGALTKPIGVVKGISDVPWHKDCSLGRHSYECCSLTVGISVNGADAKSGQLRVLAGSHRALIWPAPCVQPGLDLPEVDLPTETGDVTVHLSCTQHMSQPPVQRGRKVLYTGFSQRPADQEAADRNRRRLGKVRSKTHTTVSQKPGYLGDTEETR